MIVQAVIIADWSLHNTGHVALFGSAPKTFVVVVVVGKREGSVELLCGLTSML